MRNDDTITLVIDKRDLEDVLESLCLTISKMEKAQEALKDAADLIRGIINDTENRTPYTASVGRRGRREFI